MGFFHFYLYTSWSIWHESHRSKPYKRHSQMISNGIFSVKLFHLAKSEIYDSIDPDLLLQLVSLIFIPAVVSNIIFWLIFITSTCKLMSSYPAIIMAFQRTFMRGPENCSEADVWGSLESSDLDIIMLKSSLNNLQEKKNIKATVNL